MSTVYSVCEKEKHFLKFFLPPPIENTLREQNCALQGQTAVEESLSRQHLFRSLPPEGEGWGGKGGQIYSGGR